MFTYLSLVLVCAFWISFGLCGIHILGELLKRMSQKMYARLFNCSVLCVLTAVQTIEAMYCPYRSFIIYIIFFFYQKMFVSITWKAVL